MDGERDLLEQLMRLTRCLRRRPAEGHSGARGGHRVLGVVREAPGIRAAQLAEQLDIRPASLSERLKRLEESGFIRRAKDASDSRAVCVNITPEGEAEYARRAAERRDQSAELRACLTDDEARELGRLLDKLYKNMAREAPDDE